jgi:hypothetical protein
MLLDPAIGGIAFGKEIMYPEVMPLTMLIWSKCFSLTGGPTQYCCFDQRYLRPQGYYRGNVDGFSWKDYETN